MRHGLWHSPDFVKLWSAQATGLVGQQFSTLAIPLVAILTLHASAATVALMVTCFNLPWVVFGLFVGVLVDRFRRRSILIITDIGRAVLLLSIPVCAGIGILSLPQLFVLGMVVGTLDMCWLTAFRSYVPVVVPAEHLSQAYAQVGASDAITRTAAPSLAGVAVQLLGAPVGISVTSFCYFLSGLFNSGIRRHEPRYDHQDHDPVVRSFRDGLSYVWRQRVVRSLALSEATYIVFYSASQSVLLVFLSRNLGLAATMIGLIFTVGTVGGIVAAMVARRIGRRLTPGPTIILGSVLRSLGLALMPVAIVLGPLAIPGLMAARLINSFGWTLWDVHRETTQQQLISDRYRGRANGSVLFVGGVALAVGAATGAGIVALTGVAATLVISSVGALLAVVWLFSVRLWTIRKEPSLSTEGV